MTSKDIDDGDDVSDDEVPQVDSVEKDQFDKQLYAFMERRGTPIPDKLPQLGKRTLDLHRLFKEVSRRGGYQAVCTTITLLDSHSHSQSTVD